MCKDHCEHDDQGNFKRRSWYDLRVAFNEQRSIRNTFRANVCDELKQHIKTLITNHRITKATWELDPVDAAGQLIPKVFGQLTPDVMPPEFWTELCDETDSLVSSFFGPERLAPATKSQVHRKSASPPSPITPSRRFATVDDLYKELGAMELGSERRESAGNQDEVYDQANPATSRGRTVLGTTHLDAIQTSPRATRLGLRPGSLVSPKASTPLPLRLHPTPSNSTSAPIPPPSSHTRGESSSSHLAQAHTTPRNSIPEDLRSWWSGELRESPSTTQIRRWLAFTDYMRHSIVFEAKWNHDDGSTEGHDGL